jgi:serine protease
MKRSTLFTILILCALLVVVLAGTTPGYTSTEEGMARVWVEFRPGTKANVERALKGAGAQFHYTFDELNAFAVSLPEKALGGIRRNPNVVMIEEDAKRYPHGQTVPYGIDMVQARDVWDANRDGVIDTGAPTGAGRLVCIIDSGLHTAHEDLTNVTVIGGYPSGWNSDGCGHGTHVAGTIAAANNALGVVGVSPGTVSLYIVKVFGNDCGWAYSSDLADAANRCDAAGAKVINMSLGGGRSVRSEQNTFNNLYNKGVLSIASAGNAGNTQTSYPAGYSSVVSVAAIDSNKVVASFSQKNSTVELAAPGVGVLSTVPWTSATITVDGVKYLGALIEFAKEAQASGALVDGGLCTATNTSAWSGKVVLCERGDVSFYDKVRNVQNSGGAAAVIYNNVPGGFGGTLGSGNSSTIPAMSLSREDGIYLIANKLNQTGAVDTRIVKPGSGYEAWDGTSMAAPHVSGVAALVWSANPSWSNVQIRNALTGSAEDLGASGRDNSYGWGLVRAYNALVFLGYGGGTQPTPTPTATPTATPTPTETAEPTPNPTPTATPPTGTNITVKSLAGSSSTVNRNFWRATVVVTVEPALGGAVVSGTWSTGGSVSCTTDALGVCSVTSSNLGNSTSSVTYNVTNVVLSGYTYEPGGVTSVAISKP